MANDQQTSVDAASADSPFIITTYPSAAAAAVAQNTKSKKRKRGSSAGAAPASNGQGFHHQTAIAQLGGKFKNGQDLDMHYSISPAKQWESAKKYKSFRLNEASYMKGHYIYVANPDTVERQKSAGARNPTEEWVAQILEIRAVDEQHVFVRVAWLYWPQEIPRRTLDRGKSVQGRQPYHGTHELIASNHMDIIHALSVTEHAKVDRWVESEQDSVLAALYWRQGFDTRTGELSTVSLTCRCQTPVNPDKTLIMCTSADCGKWLHYECLEDDILMKTWERKTHKAIKREDGTHESNGIVKTEQAESPLPYRNVKTEQPETPQSNGNGVAVAFETGGRRSSSRQAPSSTPVSAMSTPLGRQGSVRGKGKKTPTAKPYTGLYEATLKTDDGPARWTIRDLRDGVPDSEKSWTEAVHCLLCDSVIV